jgi:lipoyl(octanoyl) transferase
MRLDRRPGGLRRFFADLEEVVIGVCAHFGLTALRREGFPGVWVDGRKKICSVGIAVRTWVSYHGFALNVDRDLSLFSRITLCGLADAAPTSLALELGRDDIAMQEVKDVCAAVFRSVFAHSALA